jgi:sucrose-phosphate synthase
VARFSLEPPAPWLLLSDIDGTLTGDDGALAQLMSLLAARRDRIAFGVASGRSKELVREAVQSERLNEPDLVIAGVGSEIHGPAGLAEAWQDRIRADWQREGITEVLAGVPGLQLQPAAGQSPVKLSYLATAETGRRAELALQRAGIPCTLVHSHGRFLDVLPRLASKGQAVRFVAEQLGLPLSRIIVTGDSGNDADMLQSGALAAAVGNFSPELSQSIAGGGVFVSNCNFAAGVLDALIHFGALERPARGACAV